MFHQNTVMWLHVTDKLSPTLGCSRKGCYFCRILHNDLRDDNLYSFDIPSTSSWGICLLWEVVVTRWLSLISSNYHNYWFFSFLSGLGQFPSFWCLRIFFLLYFVVVESTCLILLNKCVKVSHIQCETFNFSWQVIIIICRTPQTRRR